MHEQNLHNESELLKQVANGSEAAFEIIVRAYQKRLYTYIFKITASREISNDLVQDIFLKLWLRKEKIQEINNLNAYLHRVAHNEVYQSLQRIAKEELVLTVLRNEIRHEEDACQSLLSKEIKEEIQLIIGKLSPRQKQVFLLSREEGLKYDEIAERLNIGYETVKFHMAGALKFMRQELKNKYGTMAIIIFAIWQLGTM